MKNKSYLGIGLLILLGIFYLFYAFSSAREDKERLQYAYESYLKGEEAKTLAERSDAFNEALKAYITLEEDYQPRYGNGKLFYNIGNTYFQLAQYPFAILYYYKAKALMPRNDKVANNLKVAQEKLGIQEKKVPSFFDPFFQGIEGISLPEKIQLFSGCALLAFFLASFYIWSGVLFWRQGAVISITLAGFLLVSLVYNHYFEPIEAVLVKSTPLYRDAGFQYAKVQDEPLFSGVKVAIFDLVEEGEWVKIEAPEGAIGYVPQETLKVVGFNN